MTLNDALAAAGTANMNYLNACAIYYSLVAQGSPQPQTNNAQAVAAAALTTLKGTQAAIDTAFAAL